MSNSMSGLNFDPGATVEMLRGQVQSFATNEIAPGPRTSTIKTLFPPTCGVSWAICGLVDGSIGGAANMNEDSLPRLWRHAKLYDIGTGTYRSRRVLLDCALSTQSL